VKAYFPLKSATFNPSPLSVLLYFGERESKRDPNRDSSGYRSTRLFKVLP
jgi:hypothetical protein